MGRFIWLIAENLASTSDNNSYYFWRHTVEREDDIEKYFVMERNKKNKERFKSLPENCKKYVVWKDSVKHLKLFVAADMFFVTLSYRDIRPEHFFGREIDLSIEKPIIYLQHGTLAMKTLGYKGYTYNNNFFRFVYYRLYYCQTIQEPCDPS